MSYSDKDYQNIADAIVKDYVDRSIPLEDSALKTAQDMNLNVNETRRLVEATNVTAHLTLFSKMAEHKYVDFDVVDPEYVCDKLFADPQRSDIADSAQAPDGVKIASSWRLDIPDEHWEHRRPFVEKVAQELLPEQEPEPEFDKYAGARGYYAVNRVNKVHEELEMDLRAAHMNYQEKVAQVRDASKYMHSIPLDTLVKHAFSLFSAEDAADVSEDLIGRDNLVKVAGEIPPLVNANTEQHKLLREAVQLRQRVKTAAQALVWYREKAKKALL